MNENTMNHIRNFEENLVCVKAMVFRKTHSSGYISYATVLCNVPKEDYGKTSVKLMPSGKRRPESYGTFIRVRGFGLISPNNAMSLTVYENHLSKEGWEFVATVKSAVGKSQKQAFEYAKLYADCIKALTEK